MRMLLRWFALLLCLTLAFPAALGESDTEALTALGYQLAQEEIDALLEDATARLALHPGSVPVYLHIPAEKLTLLSPRTSWCDGSPACLDRLRELLGADNVKLTEK